MSSSTSDPSVHCACPKIGADGKRLCAALAALDRRRHAGEVLRAGEWEEVLSSACDQHGCLDCESVRAFLRACLAAGPPHGTVEAPCSICGKPMVESQVETGPLPGPEDGASVPVGLLLAEGESAHRRCVVVRAMQEYARVKQPCPDCGRLFTCGCAR